MAGRLRISDKKVADKKIGSTGSRFPGVQFHHRHPIGHARRESPLNTSSPTHAFVEIRDPGSADFEKLYRIYEEALPLSERKPRAAVEELVRRDDYRVLAVKAGEQMLSFLAVFVSLREDVALLEYLATSPQARNQGLGARMFAKSVELAGPRPLLVEFDSERGKSADRELCLRRKRFYFRQGCQQIEGLHYLMPRVGDKPPPAMDLAYCGGGCGKPPSADLIRTWLQTLYVEVYQQPKDDPNIEVMMAGFESRRAPQ